MQTHTIRPRTASLIAKLIRPWVEEGVVTIAESREIVANIRYLADKGTLVPAMAPKLLTQDEAAEMLGIGKSSFKKMEAEGKLQIRRKMVGTSVRYLNTQILQFMLADDEGEEDK